MPTCALSPLTAAQSVIDAEAAAVLAPVLEDLEAELVGAAASFSLTFTWSEAR